MFALRMDAVIQSHYWGWIVLADHLDRADKRQVSVPAILEAIREIQGAIHSRNDESPGFIGELSARLGISTQAVRFYEREGLIAPQRIGRYRMFGRVEGLRLQIVVGLRLLGFGVGDIKEIISALDAMDAKGFSEWLRSRSARHLQHLQDEQERITFESNATNELAASL